MTNFNKYRAYLIFSIVALFCVYLKLSGSLNVNNIKYKSYDLELKALETKVFSESSDQKTDPNNTVLYYADSVRHVMNYTISKNDFCGEYPNLTTIIFVWSRVKAIDKRNAIRQTWAKSLYGNYSQTRVIFVLGSAEDVLTQELVAEEDEQFGDVLQFAFVDSYHNCILKAIGVLRWTHFYCNSIEFLIKVDDDMIINTNNLAQFANINKNVTKAMFGQLAIGTKPVRNPQQKHYLSKSVFHAEYFPDYFFGSFMITSDCVRDLYRKILTTLPVIWIDDLYITGILPENTDIKRVHSNKFKILSKNDLHNRFWQLFDDIICIGHHVTPDMMRRLWRQVSSGSKKTLIALEIEIFGQKSDTKTVHNDTQLVYADSVQMVTKFRISKDNFCKKYQNLKTILFVWSRVDGSEQRNAIRQTWAQPTNSTNSAIKVLFVLGSTVDKEIQRVVVKEDQQFGDILQFQFLDNYHNCILKSIGVLRWTQFYCRRADYVMKIDDDFLVNTKKLLEFINSKQLSLNKMQISGTKLTGEQPNRNPGSKWYVSVGSYPEQYYPDFIVGPHFMTTDCVTVLYEKCLKTLPALWLEDVYITGILANNTDIERVNEKLFIRFDRNANNRTIDHAKDLFNQSICMGHNFKAKNMHKIWDQLQNKHIVTKKRLK